MRSIIVGTAGHIDHGKTALVKTLTGIDADRLEEEKRRGITIDLGFAHMELPAFDGETLRLGFVDVPGHERFVRNMLAGVGGIDLVLLAIAADEGVMPQTREHFDILQLLGVQHGITVLTKSDTVDAETLDVVRLEVEEFLRGTFLDCPAPIIAVSSLTGFGLDELKRGMVAAAGQVQPRDSHAIARLPIDRVFTMKGFGTVVTGTLASGTIRREDELEVLPPGSRVRVRGVQVHGVSADAASAGQRTALNLSGVSKDELSRGMTLTARSLWNTTSRADVRLRLLAAAPRALKNHARVHFHSYTMETTAQIVLAGLKTAPVAPSGSKTASSAQMELLPGGETFARLKLSEAALLLPGDRFIIRQFSPVVTIGGGVVLDAAPVPHMPGHAEFLKTLAGGNAEAILRARVARRRQEGISIPHLVAETGWTQTQIQKHLAAALKSGEVVQVGQRLLDGRGVEELRSRVVSCVGAFHKKNPLVGGINKEELREQIGVSSEVFEPLVSLLIHDQKLELAADTLRLPGQGVVMKYEEAESKREIEEAFASAGLQVPALKEVLAALKVDKTRAQKIVTLLLRDRVLVKVSDELIFHRMALDSLRRQVAAYRTKSAKIDVAAFKEMTGVTRKYAIPLLEYLDRERVTRRVGDAREIL